MKSLYELSQVQTELLCKIVAAGRPISLHEISGDEVGTYAMRSAIKRLQVRGLAHVAAWGLSSHTKKQIGLWVAGPGIGAKRASIAMTVEQRKAKYAERSSAKKAKRIEAIPRPTLPTHTPTMGIWGI